MKHVRISELILSTMGGHRGMRNSCAFAEKLVYIESPQPLYPSRPMPGDKRQWRRWHDTLSLLFCPS